MEDLNNGKIVSDIQISEQPETTQITEPAKKSYRGLKIANVVLFVLSALFAVASATVFGLFATSDGIGKAVIIIVFFIVPIIAIILGTVSLILSILVVKSTRSRIWIMLLDIAFILFEVIAIILCVKN